MAKGDPVYGAHNDNVNQVFSQIGVIGTLGTADAQGSSNTLPMSVDPSTGAAYVYNLGPAGTTTPAGTQDVNVIGGTVTTTMGDLTGGTIDELTTGSIVVTAGTVGTVGNIGYIHEIGTMPAISVGDITGGTIDEITNGSIVVTAGTVGTVGNIGYIHEIGTMPAISVGDITGGTIDQITNGSIHVTAGTMTLASPGTITSGSIAVTAGTVVLASPGTITSGTITPSGGTVGTVPGVGVVSKVTSGTIQNSGTVTGVGTVPGVGVLTTVTNLTNGSVKVTAGTVNSGTINAGTIRNDGRPARDLLSFATTQVFSASAFATVVGSAAVGAGTSIWVNDVSIVNHNGTVQAGLMFGSAINGTPVLAKGMFGAQGGIQKSFPMPVNCGMTNFDLNCWSDAAGTVTFNVSYFISA